ncbi:Sensor protein TorS [Posidoniimonas polymericola]|uniref:Sensor protein TorS n=1 Tax=Posidoniimonas polymericola TaxID=2528002 RepID=A0A5C5YU28_9BACT|nr:chemotaxis protein CheB [Posidoniimonas polymericola]TWT78321.1 Sensor protein TorS [Posidoniimonas polymericola]
MNDKRPEYVVGIGASAGGLQSLEKLFDRLDQRTGAAYVVVQHLSPNYETMMDRLLGRHTGMEVAIAEHGQPLEPDHVYVIPPKQDLIVADGKLRLSDQDAMEMPHLTIDRLFASIAKEFGDRSVGVVLSGTGSDGSKGVQAIRNAGGLVLCESEATAKFSGMPRSAQSTGCVDHVLPAENMPRIIVRQIIGLSHAEQPDEASVDTILRLMRERLQVDFSQYKPATVTRRIDRRMSLSNVSSLESYVELLKSDPGQIDQLYQDMLIGVTKFFRDPACFDFFEKEVAPALLHDADPDAGLRVWVPGCATGEEAYTIAMILHELNKVRPRPVSIKIFASDIHPGSLRLGSLATYREAAIENVSAERLAHHFELHEDQYRIRKHIRQLVLCAPHNLLQDPPFTSLDMVSCRNLLIYFDHAAQNRALTLFHFGLKQAGVLFLGPSETVGDLANEFRTVHDKYRFYRKVGSARLPRDAALPVTLSPRRTGAAASIPGVGKTAAATAKQDTYDALLDQLLPPTLLIDQDRRVVELYGGAERFLTLRRRRMSTDLLDMCPESLQGTLSIGMRRVLVGGEEVVRLPATRIDSGGEGGELVCITMNAVRMPAGERYVAVCFTPHTAEEGDADPPSEQDGVLLEINNEDGELSKRIRELEDDLAATQENLQATIEELETSNEELQATNEELVSSNEELQSSNEELNSVNEELHTVNVEYQNKNAELRELNDDMNHLLASTDVGTIFLDPQLAIRRFTPGISGLFNLEDQDVGRPISVFSHSLDMRGLDGRLRDVLQTGKSFEREVTALSGATYFLRILPYEVSSEVTGVTLTLTNIETLVAARERADKAQRRLQKTIDAVPVFVSFVNRKRCYEYANNAYSELFGIPTEEMIGMPVREVLSPNAYARSEPRIERALAGEAQHFETVFGNADKQISAIVDYRPERNAAGEVTGFYVSASDISSLKQAERELESAMEAAKLANEAKSEFLAKMSHEIRSPMSAILGFAELLKRQLKEPDNVNCIEIIRSNGEHLLSLINDLLDLSQIEMRRVELSSDIVNVRTLLSDSCNTLQPRAAQNRVSLQAKLCDNLEAGMLTDSRRLKQIVLNLLTNAIKFSEGGRVVLSARRSRRRNELWVTIADSGCGISRGDLKRLFEPFTQVDSSNARAQEGSGLGLAITKQLVQQMGGRMLVRSQVDLGSVFQVRLPWRKLLPVARGTGNQPDLIEELPRLDGARVLVIDDRRDMRFLAEQVLADVGAQVQVVGDGASGLKSVAEADQASEPYACVITDIQMPEMDGYAVARQLRSRQYSGPILALTANAMASDRQKCFEAGCTGFISKPIDRVQLVRTVAEAISNGEH